MAGMLAAAGLPVLDADKIAREVVEPGSPCLAALARAFSPDILRPDGTLDRKRLAALAFQDDASAKKLSAVTHPAIIARSLARLQEWEAAGCRAAVVDAPLLYESGMDAICGLVAYVFFRKPVYGFRGFFGCFQSIRLVVLRKRCVGRELYDHRYQPG